MTVWNVAVPVVALVEADTEDGALQKMFRALDKAGFDVYEGELPEGCNAFESEEATEPSLPGDIYEPARLGRHHRP